MIGNSLKFTIKGYVKISVYLNSKYLITIKITDTGLGIKEEVIM